jgi:hypothetical protein
VATAISAVLPQALGAAISPIQITIVILLLFAPGPRMTAPAFAIGCALGLFAAVGIAYLIGNSQDVANTSAAADLAFTLKVGLGGLLLVLARRQWRDRNAAKEQPAWMRALDRLTPVTAVVLGCTLPNPKNVVLGVAAGTSIVLLDISKAAGWGAVIVFVVLGTSTLWGPVIYFFVAKESAEANLGKVKSWLVENEVAVTIALLVFFGVVLISEGLQGLLA